MEFGTGIAGKDKMEHLPSGTSRDDFWDKLRLTGQGYIGGGKTEPCTAVPEDFEPCCDGRKVFGVVLVINSSVWPSCCICWTARCDSELMGIQEPGSFRPAK